LKVPTRNLREFRFSLELKTSRVRSLVDSVSPVVLKLVCRVSAFSRVFDRSWLLVMVVWLTSEPGSPLTPLLGPNVEAEPAEMLAAQQTETRPTAAVAATTR
jgi:hypothetical protein